MLVADVGSWCWRLMLVAGVGGWCWCSDIYAILLVNVSMCLRLPSII
ncbi:hypothetical protein KAE70_03580 [Bartonella henselae]|nr:hypothetical protein [Bartonella henselae]UJM33563.1 hypothetical protein KAE70_03580 [Bartonella henselae]